MESLYDHDIARCAHEPHGMFENATASWSAVVLRRFEWLESGSGLAHSKTYWRIGRLREEFQRPQSELRRGTGGAPASSPAAPVEHSEDIGEDAGAPGGS